RARNAARNERRSGKRGSAGIGRFFPSGDAAATPPPIARVRRVRRRATSAGPRAPRMPPPWPTKRSRRRRGPPEQREVGSLIGKDDRVTADAAPVAGSDGAPAAAADGVADSECSEGTRAAATAVV